MSKRRPRRGRPAGVANHERPIVAVYPAACPRCHSTDREPWTRIVREVEHHGTDASTGRPYTHVVWKDTSCRACSQHYRVRIVENRSEENI